MTGGIEKWWWELSAVLGRMVVALRWFSVTCLVIIKTERLFSWFIIALIVHSLIVCGGRGEKSLPFLPPL